MIEIYYSEIIVESIPSAVTIKRGRYPPFFLLNIPLTLT